jgi:hypothetical protein
LALTEAFLQLTSIPCAENFFNVVGVGLLLSVYLKKAEVPKATIFLFLMISIHSMLIASFAVFGMVSAPPFCPGLFQDIETNNITVVKSMELLMIEYGGNLHFKPVMPLFGWQGYALLHEKDMTFLHEFNMPPQLSKGKSNVPMAYLPERIYSGDIAGCRAAVSEMRAEGVQALAYALDRDISLPSDFDDSMFTDSGRLGQCDILLLSNYSTPTATAVVYKIQ